MQSCSSHTQASPGISASGLSTYQNIVPSKDSFPFLGEFRCIQFSPPFSNSIQVYSPYLTTRCGGKALLLLSSLSTARLAPPTCMSGWSSTFHCRGSQSCLGILLLWYEDLPLFNKSSMRLPSYCCFGVWLCCFVSTLCVCPSGFTLCFHSQKCTFSLATCPRPTMNPQVHLLCGSRSLTSW